MIHVRAPGMFTTVQDLGRPGHGPLGVSPSGAADPIALRIGNLLVGNAPGVAALEMTLLGGALEFTIDAVLALAGAGDGVLPLWRAFSVRAGAIVKVGGMQSGARSYLCVRGGISVPLFLGSASTHILSGLGGYQGRALCKGDVLQIGPVDGPQRPVRVNPVILAKLAPRKLLRVTPGLQWDWFSPSSHEAFLSGVYRVTDESNRMGLRLEGAALKSTARGHMITEGVPLGAIQIPAGGQPIILFVEQQTTGGYPKIANVISADLASIGQLRPRDEIRFQLVSYADARRLICEQEEDLCLIIEPE